MVHQREHRQPQLRRERPRDLIGGQRKARIRLAARGDTFFHALRCPDIPETFERAGSGTGFKLGEATPSRALERVVRPCVAYRNRLWGFVENNARVGTELLNNTSVRNGGRNFWFGSWDAEGTADDHPIVVRHNLAFGPAGPELDEMPVTFAGFLTLDHNRWMAPFVVDERDFESLDEAELRATRGADGALLAIRFLHLAATSDLLSAGADAGLAFNGRAPDLGAFER